MLTILLFGCFGVVFGGMVIAGIIIEINSRNSNGDPVVCAALGGAFLAITVIVALITIPCMHAEALGMPFKIAALERTIDQQKELISIDATLGQGLEGLEMKHAIQDNISKLNNMIARAEYITISPWWMFKPKMSE